MIKVSDNLRVLAAEASAAQHVAVDAGAVDMLLHELRRKFVRVAVDLPRGVSPMHRVVLAAASQVVVFCEHSLAGLRDTIRLQTLVREQAPQARLLARRGGGQRRARSDRQERVRKGDRQIARREPFLRPQIRQCRSQFGPTSAGRGAAQRNRARTAPADCPAGRSRAGRCQKKPGLCPSVAMVAFFKRPAAEDGLDARIAVLSRRAQPLAKPPDPEPTPLPPAALGQYARSGAGDRSPGGAEHCPCVSAGPRPCGSSQASSNCSRAARSLR